jgi:probable phosphoglycerate mutase
MTTFLLIRHGLNDAVGKRIAGRAPGTHLNDTGREQAERLAELLAHEPICRIISSPLERAQETAAPLAERLKLPVEIAEELNEVDYGEWTGRALTDLDRVPQWRAYNSFRVGTRVPGGELIIEIQARVLGLLDRLRQQSPEDTLALVCHGDVIKSAVCPFLSIPIDLMLRLEISPASITALSVRDFDAKVLYVNRTAD